MERSYYEQDVPARLVAAGPDPTLAPARHVDGTTTTGVPELGEPEEQRGGSIQYHRPPIGGGLLLDVQAPTMGAEVKQSGAGRAFITPALTFPEQSPTPEPDRRRIARPMPTMARDQVEVIRPRGVGDA